ncbi:hypothetical protein Syun_025359 [Stephania yunnanensis]|uniref:Uncharacterized protein n=1 Tax=Stephania yunnanensis TaxID=152371 RepID=A0AAP0ES15_9MAGN
MSSSMLDVLRFLPIPLSSFKALITRPAADGTTDTFAQRFRTVSFTVTRGPSSPWLVSLAMSSPIFFGERRAVRSSEPGSSPRQPRRRCARTYTSPPRWIELRRHVGERERLGFGRRTRRRVWSGRRASGPAEEEEEEQGADVGGEREEAGRGGRKRGSARRARGSRKRRIGEGKKPYCFDTMKELKECLPLCLMFFVFFLSLSAPSKP